MPLLQDGWEVKKWVIAARVDYLQQGAVLEYLSTPSVLYKIVNESCT